MNNAAGAACKRWTSNQKISRCISSMLLKARAGVPHRTVTVPGYEKDRRVQELERSGTRVEKNSRNHPDGKGYSLYVQDPDGNLWEL